VSRALVKNYVDRGWRFVPWPQIGDSKGPREDGWQLKTYTLADYHDGYRVGIKTGVEVKPKKFLHDVDIDWAPGFPVASALLPPTNFMFGRPSKRISHCFYTLPEAVSTFKYEDIDGTSLIEIRGVKKDGTLGFQTMAPPSVWSNKEGKKEPLDFARSPSGKLADGDPAHIETAIALKQRVCLTAIGMLLAKNLGVNGFGHDPRLAWAGFLLRAGIDREQLIAMGEGMSEPTHNVQTGDVRTVVESTWERLQAKGRNIKGGPALVKILGANGEGLLQRINDWLRRDYGGVPDSAIVMRGGQLTEIVDRAEIALLNTPIYQRGGVLVRSIKLDKATGEPDDVRRAAGSTVLIRVSEAWLVEQMGRVLRWYKVNAKGENKMSDPSPIYAHTLASRGEWRFPPLRGVVTAPTLAIDGRIIEVPGFDAASGLLLDFPPGVFPPIPIAPTREDAQAALAKLLLPLRKFPFVDGASKSVALSAMLAGLVRLSLRTTPLHGYDSPTAGTGKSLLAELVGLLATGVKPPALSQGKSNDEDEKRLSTVLFAGDLVIHIDNCDLPITGDFLCSMLTAETVQARILGQSERRIFPSRALVQASGVNLTLAGDASRRAVICRLDAQVERPDTRVFDFDCHAEVLAARPELVVAGLTILRAYRLIGRLEKKLTPMGSFTDWDWIRGALVWLECDDPADTRLSILDSDPMKDELLNVMELWEGAFDDPSKPIEVAEIDRLTVIQRRQFGEIAKEGGVCVLRDKLVEVACKGGVWNSKSVGWWLRRNKDRIIRGRCFRSGKGGDGNGWWLEKEQRSLPEGDSKSG
jgi:hypothetical protein